MKHCVTTFICFLLLFATSVQAELNPAVPEGFAAMQRSIITFFSFAIGFLFLGLVIAKFSGLKSRQGKQFIISAFGFFGVMLGGLTASGLLS